MRVFIAVLTTMMLLAPPAVAQDESAYDTGVRPTGDECMEDGAATAVVLSELLESSLAFKGRCVTTEGYILRDVLFISKADMNVKHPGSSPKLQGRRLGLYGRDDIQNELRSLPKGQYVRLTGKVWNCNAMRTSSTLMLVGYCHYTSGATLSVVAFEKIPAPK
jgi:hypothetical protein